MDFKDYQEKAWSFALETAKNNYYIATGLVAEVGEYYGHEAKYIRDGGNYLEIEKKLKKELGDILWFVAAQASINGWDLQEIADGNISKLTARKEFGTLRGSGDDR